MTCCGFQCIFAVFRIRINYTVMRIRIHVRLELHLNPCYKYEIRKQTSFFLILNRIFLNYQLKIYLANFEKRKIDNKQFFSSKILCLLFQVSLHVRYHQYRFTFCYLSCGFVFGPKRSLISYNPDPGNLP